jgi:major vault protein
MSASSKPSDTVFRLAPFTYIQVLDATSNIMRVELGPQTFIRQDNQKVVFGPAKMVTIPPRHYARIKNPVARAKDGGLVYEGEYRQIKLRHAEEEIRLAQGPFPLYPGEELVGGIQQLTMVAPDSALRLKAIQDFNDVSLCSCVVAKLNDYKLISNLAPKNVIVHFVHHSLFIQLAVFCILFLHLPFV